jgi:sortase (surface protein transpeptidase)
MTRIRRLLPLLLALALLTGAAAPASAASLTVARQWRAGFGTAAVNGRLWLSGYTNGTGDARFALKSLKAAATYRAVFRKGSCSTTGTLLASVTGLKTNASGVFNGTVNIPYASMIKLGTAARTMTVSVRLTLGTWVRCAQLTFDRATKVYIPSYKINLAVVPGPNAYPYCKVAMYLRSLWQPGEPGMTFIYAHARTGMFLPLLNASKINNGAAMIGKLVYVYTSNSLRYTYRISQVRRHVKSGTTFSGTGTEQLWLQTSEGPNYRYPKLIVVAQRIAVTPVTYLASHPVPHPQVCG